MTVSFPRTRKRICKSTIIALTGLCAVLIGSSSTVMATPVLTAQQATSRTPQIITGQLDQNSAVLEDDGRYYEAHTLDGKADEALTIELTTHDFDALLILLSPTGESIAADDNGAGGTNARITITLPITGTYTIGASSYQAGEIGEYQLVWRAATLAAQDLAIATQLTQQVFKLYRAGRYIEAIPLAKRALAIRELQLGPEHPDTALSLNNLAALYA